MAAIFIIYAHKDIKLVDQVTNLRAGMERTWILMQRIIAIYFTGTLVK
jgi:hypothetical protein